MNGFDGMLDMMDKAADKAMNGWKETVGVTVDPEVEFFQRLKRKDFQKLTDRYGEEAMFGYGEYIAKKAIDEANRQRK